MTCSVDPECGFDCPPATDTPCGAKNPHVITVASASPSCVGGGEYRLFIEVKNKKGNSLEAKAVKLGGGDKKKLPKWFDPDTSFTSGPALDDEKVPLDGGDPLDAAPPPGNPATGPEPNKR